ncbi:MAG TPA: nuclear transport factor 2 family protein [Jatrophihabitantaceae bacterium]|jgi:ketosteroid isomerase-like protein
MATHDDGVRRLLDQDAIMKVIYRYCRGIDRRNFDLVRSCYHDDAVDTHGSYQGDVEGFLARTQESLRRCEMTTHFIGNTIIDVDSDSARSEAYALAFHRLAATDRHGLRDRVVALRYVDRFERRRAEWRIATRVCVTDWTRTDPVPRGWDFPAGWSRGVAGASDPTKGYFDHH